jgi:hypothetical protein
MHRITIAEAQREFANIVRVYSEGVPVELHSVATRSYKCSETNRPKTQVSPLLPENRPAQLRNLG